MIYNNHFNTAGIWRKTLAACSIFSIIISIITLKHLAYQFFEKQKDASSEIDEIESEIHHIMDTEIQSPIPTIPGIGYRTGAMIIAEIGDFSRFDCEDKILPYAGSPILPG